jgi:hypothetical protein
MSFQKIAPDVKLGKDVKVYDFVNLYGCTIGDPRKTRTFVEFRKGQNRRGLQSLFARLSVKV